MSRTLAKALFGAALGDIPSLASADDGTPTLPLSASAEERSYGPARPGLGTPASTMAPGRVSVETGFAAWERDDTGGVRSDTILLGDTLVRVGITPTVEVLAGWTPFGHVRVRDAAGNVDQADRVGDALLGFKANLRHPDGSGLSAAVQPFVILPIGRTPVGVGDWGAGVVLPVSYDLADGINVALTSEIDAATDSDGDGRHLSYSVIGGVTLAMTKTVSLTAELSTGRDDDPDGHVTQSFASLSAAWSVRDDLQFDVGATAGLNRDSADFSLYAGISRRF